MAECEDCQKCAALISDRGGAPLYIREGIFEVTFDDGSSLRFDLCSGTHNYWDDVVWTSADGNTDVTLDCEYELDNIEVDIEGETYIVEVKKDHLLTEG